MSNPLDIVKTATVTTSHNGIVPADGLREMLGLPSNARLHVSVPGGGDWSSCDLVLGDDVQLKVSWETTTTD